MADQQELQPNRYYVRQHGLQWIVFMVRGSGTSFFGSPVVWDQEEDSRWLDQGQAMEHARRLNQRMPPLPPPTEPAATGSGTFQDTVLHAIQKHGKPITARDCCNLPSVAVHHRMVNDPSLAMRRRRLSNTVEVLTTKGLLRRTGHGWGTTYAPVEWYGEDGTYVGPSPPTQPAPTVARE